MAILSCKPKKQAVQSLAAASAGKPLIVVSILPQEWFVKNIAGDRVEVSVLVGPGQDVHDYEPTPKQIAGLANASAWLLSGAEFEIPFKAKVAAMFPQLPIIDGTQGVTWRYFDNDDQVPGDTDEDEKQGNIDRHSWLGEQGAEVMAGHVRDLLNKLEPSEAQTFNANYETTIAAIKDTFVKLTTELAPLKGSQVFVYHPAFGYFLDQFGIAQRAVETGGKEPTPRELSELVVEARKAKPRAIFVEAQFPVSTAQTLAKAVGAKVVPLDPLAEDWLNNIKAIGEALLAQ
jgi:zinc transport system substrate-binding protein